MHRRGFVTTAGRVGFILLLLSVPTVSAAQGVGFVGGATIDPEQFFVGAFFETPAIAETVHFRPGVSLGSGESLRIVSVNIDFVYKSDESSGWRFVTGGGPVIRITRFDDPLDTAEAINGRDISGGLIGMLGVEHNSGFFAEFKFGGTDSGPNLLFGAGFRFGGGRP